MGKLTTWANKDNPNFVIGKEYWTFFMETTNSGDSLRNVVRVFKTKVVSTQVIGTITYLRFELPETLKLGRTMKANLPTFMNGYGTAYCDFYDTEEEAKEAFDERIKEIARGQTANARDFMYTKMYKKIKPSMSKIEEDSKEWEKTLTKEQKSYLEWFIQNR